MSITGAVAAASKRRRSRRGDPDSPGSARPTSLLGRLDATGVPLLIVRLALGGWFAYLAILKLQDPFLFLKLVNQYQVLPTQPPVLINFLTLMLPYLELVCAALLILGVWVRASAALVLGMLLFFAPLLVARAWSLYAGGAFPGFCAVKFDCGCGTGEVYICSKLGENAALMLAVLVAIASRSRRWCVEGLIVRRDSLDRAGAEEAMGRRAEQPAAS